MLTFAFIISAYILCNGKFYRSQKWEFLAMVLLTSAVRRQYSLQDLYLW